MLADNLRRLTDQISRIAEPEESLELRARRVLQLIAESPSQPIAQPSVYGPELCPNCGTATASRTSPYCSAGCKDKAAFVRQFRAALSTEAVFEPEKQLALGQKLWALLGGGLPYRESLIPNSALKQVRKRSEGRCEICGEPAERIENFGSG